MNEELEHIEEEFAEIKPQNLGKQALMGAFWSYMQQFGTMAIQLLNTMVLSRLLQPSEFGLIAMLAIFIQVSSVLVQGGMTQSLIRSKKVDSEDLSTVFYFNFGVSILLYLILFFASPWIAAFYKQEVLESILKVYALVFVINAFGMVQVTMLMRAMDFKRQTIVTIIGIITSGVVGISFAFAGFGVWSLVYAQIANAAIMSALYWYLSKWRPSLLFSKVKFKIHFGFGYKLSMSAVTNVLFQSLYVIVIGRIFPLNLTGFYSQATRLRDLPINALSGSLNKVSFPLFSKYTNDDDLREMFRKITMSVIFIVAPLMIFISAFSNEILHLLFSKKWIPAAPYLSLLCFAGMLTPIHAFNLNILLTKGRSDLFFRLSLVKKGLVILILLLTYSYGIEAIIIGQLINSIIAVPINAYYIERFIHYKFLQQVKDLLPPIIISLIIGALFYLLKKYFFVNTNYLFILIVLGFSFFIVYILLSKILRIKGFTLSFELIKKFLNKSK